MHIPVSSNCISVLLRISIPFYNYILPLIEETFTESPKYLDVLTHQIGGVAKVCNFEVKTFWYSNGIANTEKLHCFHYLLSLGEGHLNVLLFLSSLSKRKRWVFPLTDVSAPEVPAILKKFVPNEDQNST